MEKRYDAKFSAVFATLKQMPEVPVLSEKRDRLSRQARRTKIPALTHRDCP
jgi:hypothetical protein